MRARNKLLSEERWDASWLSSLEAAMAEHGKALAEGRARTIEALDEKLGQAPDDEFPRAAISLDGWNGADLAGLLSANRQRDSAAGRATEGPHRQDLAVVHRAKQMLAAHSSTGEQKAMLLGLVLAHRDLVAQSRGEPPILLLDEVAAHLDPKRRNALFARIEAKGQVWMTATEAGLFEGVGAATRFRVRHGKVDEA
jgi:DNA replication and repair protein RecF